MYTPASKNVPQSTNALHTRGQGTFNKGVAAYDDLLPQIGPILFSRLHLPSDEPHRIGSHLLENRSEDVGFITIMIIQRASCHLGTADNFFGRGVGISVLGKQLSGRFEQDSLGFLKLFGL